MAQSAATKAAANNNCRLKIISFLFVAPAWLHRPALASADVLARRIAIAVMTLLRRHCRDEIVRIMSRMR
jgi:hypothetical protein